MTEYVRNSWYMAAWEHELADRDFIARTLLDERWLIYRLSTGEVAMIRDRCPHRFAPLSMGQRQGDVIACGYHGLAFDHHGKCVLNPFSDLIPENARVESRRAVVRNGIVWFWPSEPATADETTIADFSFLDEQPDMHRGVTWMQGNYELITDNLMDLSHAEFIHQDTFQMGGAILKGQYRARDDADGTIWSNWEISDIPVPVFAREQNLEHERVDQFLHMRWNAPASMMLSIGLRPLGGGDILSHIVNPHIITPETESSSHYFFTCFPGEDSVRFTRQVFDEQDRPFIEAIERELGGADFWKSRPAILSVDGGSVRARRRLAKMRREQTQAFESAA